MEPYSPAEEPVNGEKPAPYNWLLLLAIFIAYIVFAVFS